MPLFKPNITNKSSGLYSGTANGGFGVDFDDGNILDFLKVQDGEKDYVTAQDALKNSDIYSIVFQLSSDLATSTLTADDQRMQAMLEHPSDDWSNAHSFWQSVYAQLLLGGESFVYRWRNVNGQDLRWEYLRPSQVNVFATQDFSNLFYNVTFNSPNVGFVEGIPYGDMLHFRLLSQNGGATGLSPLYALSNELNIKGSSDRLTLSALAKSVMNPGILKVDTGLLDDKRRTLMSKRFQSQISNSNGGPIVLDKLTDYTPLEVKGDVSKLLNQTDWTSKQIAKAYGVSDNVLNGQGDQQSSVEMLDGQYAKSLNRFASPITSELTSKLNTPVSMNIKPAIDPVGDQYTTSISEFQKNGMLTDEQSIWLLKNSGYLPQDLPDAPVNQPGKEDS